MRDGVDTEAVEDARRKWSLIEVLWNSLILAHNP